MTVPPRASRNEALAFVERSRAWIAGRLGAQPQPIAFAPGAEILLRGIAARHQARTGTARPHSRRQPIPALILVPGDAAASEAAS